MTGLYKIKLKTIHDAKRFCRLCKTLECETLLIGGNYRVNAKSLLGIFSLDFSKPLLLELEDSNYNGLFYEWLEEVKE